MSCIITGCQNPANNHFGVRLRRTDTSAIWAPNTEAYICDHHAVVGLRIDVQITPSNDGNITTAISGGGIPAVRTTPIVNQA
ncbi:hypothetical protein GCM43_19005 [Janthinobacterium aquaticum]|nr:hypothetical protein GCM43_19005 [Janthinobacterium sp. FT58W]